MAFEQRIAALQRRKCSLGEQISQLAMRPGSDDMVIRNLKKQRLLIKDEISRLYHH